MVPVTQSFRHSHDLGGEAVKGLLQGFFVSEISEARKHTFELSLYSQHSKFHVSFAWLVLVLRKKNVCTMRVWLSAGIRILGSGEAALKTASQVQSLVQKSLYKAQKERKYSRATPVSESQGNSSGYVKVPE